MLGPRFKSSAYHIESRKSRYKREGWNTSAPLHGWKAEPFLLKFSDKLRLGNLLNGLSLEWLSKLPVVFKGSAGAKTPFVQPVMGYVRSNISGIEVPRNRTRTLQIGYEGQRPVKVIVGVIRRSCTIEITR